MTSVRLTDSEVAVVVDMARETRDALHGGGNPAPNVEAVLAKFQSLILPSTDGLYVSTELDTKPLRCEAGAYVGSGHQSRIQCDLDAGHADEQHYHDPGCGYEWTEDGECVD